MESFLISKLKELSTPVNEADAARKLYATKAGRVWLRQYLELTAEWDRCPGVCSSCRALDRRQKKIIKGGWRVIAKALRERGIEVR